MGDIAAEKPTYQLGYDGSDGAYDCIGLVIGAIRRAGGLWSGTHSSNYAARCEVAYLLPIEGTGDLILGEVVFKAAMLGGPGYALPGRYAEDPDQRDYYHVGVVTCTEPLEITHSTGPGIVQDVKLGKWAYRGWLTKVKQEGVVDMADESQVCMGMATVFATTGGTVNLRQKPHGALVERVPVGASVEVLMQEGGWSSIRWGEKTGWMMDKYLRWITDQTTPDDLDSGQSTLSLTLTEAAAQTLFQALADALDKG